MCITRVSPAIFRRRVSASHLLRLFLPTRTKDCTSGSAALLGVASASLKEVFHFFSRPEAFDFLDDLYSVTPLSFKYVAKVLLLPSGMIYGACLEPAMFHIFSAGP